MEEQLQELLRKAEDSGVRMSVGIKELGYKTDSQRLLLGSLESYAPAAAIKLPLALAVAHAISFSEVKLDQPVLLAAAGDETANVQDLLRKMVVECDERSTRALYGLVGQERLDEVADAYELRDTSFAPPTQNPDDGSNRITVDAGLQLLTSLYAGVWVDKDTRNLLLSLLAEQQLCTPMGDPRINYTAPILSECSRFVHDLGYLLRPGYETAIAVLTENLTTSNPQEAFTLAKPFIQEVAKTVCSFH